MKTLFVSGFVILLAISAWATLNNDSDMTQSQNMGGEGIELHGDWEVKIIDTDGSSEVFAFKNALTTPGAWVLTALLSGETSVKSPPVPLPLFYSQVNYNVGPEDLSKVCANTTSKPSWNMQGSVSNANWNTLIPTYSMDDSQGAAISVTTTCEYIGDTEDQIDSVYTYVELNKGIPKNPWNFRGGLNCLGKDECTLQKLTVKVLGMNSISVSPGDTIEITVRFSFNQTNIF